MSHYETEYAAARKQTKQRAKRATALLNADKGVTYCYAAAALDEGLVDYEDVRRVRTDRGYRYYLS